ncbi:MAG TPA: fibronectin type III domain-containing protein, partial [Bacteroidales bacterium]|nr:fibronectin type III domain-containing protein [Bacteroidales bacterium]
MKKFLPIAFLVFIIFLIKTTSAQNYGLSFTNQNMYAQAPLDPTLELTGPLTLEAWIYPTAWKTNVYQGCILNKEGLNFQGYMLRCGANGTLNFNIGSGTQWKELNSSTGALTLNTWQHVAGVFDGTTLKIYVNGAQVGSTLSYTGSVATNLTIPLEVGRSNYYPDRNFLGRIDEVRIWNTALSSTDIAAYYNATLTASHPNYSALVAYYEMDNFNTDTDSDGNLDFTATVGPTGEVYGAPYVPACNPLFSSSAPAGITSIEAYQSTTSPASLGGTNQHVLKIAVDAFAELNLSQLVFQTNGTTSISDILNARVWLTGSNDYFSPTTQFGSTITAPPAAGSNMTFTGSQTIPCGRSYIWLTYDIDQNATLTNLIDATFLSATIDGSTLAPTTSDPTGSREIAATCSHTLRITATISGGWNGGLVDVLVNGTPTLTGIGSTFTTGTGPVDFTFNAGTADAISIVRTAAGTYPTRMRVQILDGNGTSVLAAIEPTTTGVNTTGYCGGIVYTTAATSITAYSAQLNGSYANCIPLESGFRYKKTAETTWNFVQDFNNPMAYDLQGLDPATNYHYQSYAIVGVDTLWGTTVSFATTCVPYTIPFAESFNSTTIPLCWTNSSSNPFNFVTSGTSPSATPFFGSGMARFAGYSYTSGQVGYLVTPALDNLTTGMEVRFWFYRQDFNNSYTVGALRVKANSSNNPTNAVLLTTIQRVYNQSPAELTPGWYEYVAIIPADTFTHIIFECTSDWYGNMYLDEVSIDYPASCPRPPANSVTIPTVLNNAATINWIRGGMETEWEVSYKPDTETTWISEPAYDTLHVLYGLIPATTYNVKVRAVCAPGDYSLWTFERTFTTLCDPIPTLPVVEDFETTTTGQIPVCYNKLISGTATVGVTNSDGSMVCNFSSGSVSNNCFLILPLTVDPINTLRIMFKYYGGSNHLFKIGYITDATNASSFVELHNAPLSTNESWKSFDIITNNTLDGSERIAIKFVMAYGYSARIDSLVIMNQPPCVEPTGLVLTNSSINDATVSWAGSGVSYNLEYKEVTETIWTTVNSITPPYTIYGLLQNTAYEFKVQTICDGGAISGWSPAATFNTLCDLITVLPYIQDFESTAVNEIPTCYNKIQSGGGGVKVIDITSEQPGAGKVLQMDFGSSSSGDAYFILPKFDFPVNTLRVSFKYYGGNANHRFGYVTDPTNPASFVEVVNQTLIGVSGGLWYHIDLLTNNTLTGNERIAIRYSPAATWHNNRYDSLTVDIMPSCLPPFELTATSITTTAATLSWSSAGTGIPIDYNLQFRPLGETNWTVLNNVTSPYLLQGLNSSTTYQYQIQSNCGSGDLSDWSTTSSFMTACGAITTLPWSESFDTYGTLTTSYPTCWTKSQLGSNSLYISTTNASSPGSLYSYIGSSGNYNIAVTPPFDLSIPVNTLKADFKYRVSGNDDTLYIGVMTSPTDASSFELIATRIPSTTGAFQDMEVYFNNYIGVGQYIAFKTAYTTSASISYLDNVVVSTIPACPIPSFLTSSNITAYAADFSWIENGVASSWIIEYGPVGFTPGTGTPVIASTNPFTVSGLSPNTTYQFYIQSDCGGSYSDYSSPTTITTGLIPITLPYVNDFENPTTYADFGFLNGTQSNKWQIGSAAGVNNTVGGTNAMYISNDNGTSWAYTGGSAGNSKVYAYLDIEVPVGVNELLLDFDWIAKGSLYNYEFLRVYLMPLNVPVVAGSNPPTFNSINYDAAGQVGNYVGGIGEHWLSQQTTWQHKQFSINATQFPNLAGNTWRLYFHWRNDQTTA